MIPSRIVTDFETLVLKGTPILDVRAPVEFESGHIPGAINIPILNNEERAQVGTEYKTRGQDAAVELGHKLVSGNIKAERVKAWTKFFETHPHAVITCFRGGMRSALAQEWLSNAGVVIPRIGGGYKAMRNFLVNAIQNFCEKQEFKLVCGLTGSGKTYYLNQIKTKYKVLDLEGLACHRGSAFGGLMHHHQPSQPCFENALAIEMLKIKNSGMTGPVYLENESRMIGKCIVPEPLFSKMALASELILEVSLEERTQIICKDYVLDFVKDGDSEPLKRSEIDGKFDSLENSVLKIKNKLGGARTSELIADMRWSRSQMNLALAKNNESKMEQDQAIHINAGWIKKLLKWYYDPLYEAGFKRRMESKNESL